MENRDYDYFLVNKSKLKSESIIRELREKGYRVTKQRKLIIDTILNNECTSCKEIYWKVSQKDNSIGIATVYRIINSLEAIGILDRKNLYKIFCEDQEILNRQATVTLKDKGKINLSNEMWQNVLKTGLRECNIQLKDVDSIVVNDI